MSIIREHGRLIDSWAISHNDSFLPEADAVHEPHHALAAYGVTADSPLNTWSAHKNLDGVAARWKGKRLDYVLYRAPARPRGRRREAKQQQNGLALETDPFDLEPRLHCTSSLVVLTGKVPGIDMSLSDHFGVEAVLSIQVPSPSSPTFALPLPAAPSVWGGNSANLYRDNVNLTQSSTLTDPSQRPPTPPSEAPAHPQDNATYDDMGYDIAGEPGLTPHRVDDMLHVISTAYTSSLQRSRQHLLVFGACVISLFGLVVGSAWQPLSAANPVMIAAAGGLTWVGTTMLYSGFVWGRWEANTLMNFVEELEHFSRRRAIRASLERPRRSA